MCLPGHSRRQQSGTRTRWKLANRTLKITNPIQQTSHKSQLTTSPVHPAQHPTDRDPRGANMEKHSTASLCLPLPLSHSLPWPLTGLRLPGPPHGVSNDSSRCAMQVEASWAHGLPVEFVSPGHGDFALHDDAVQGLSFTFLSPIDRGLFGPRSGQKQGADAPR